MNGLKEFPFKKKFIDAYEALQFKKGEVSEADVALYSQWARLDPRLAEILIRFISENWGRLNPLKLNHLLQLQPWPSALGVLLEFAKKAILPQRKKLFFCWAETVSCEVKKNSFWSQFFWGQRSIGGAAMFDDARFSSREYQKWNYLGRENLFNKNKFSLKYSPEIRFEILKTLSQKKKEFHHTGLLERHRPKHFSKARRKGFNGVFSHPPGGSNQRSQIQDRLKFMTPTEVKSRMTPFNCSSS